MSCYLPARAIIAATTRHVTIVDHSIRIDLRLDSDFSPAALCQAMEDGVSEFAAFIGEDDTAIAESLASGGLLAASPPAKASVPGAIPLAAALLGRDRLLAASSVIYTADEAFWPGNDLDLARFAFRVFVSRLVSTGRCVIYAALAAGGDVHVTGDQPAAAQLEQARGTLAGTDQPCVVDLHSGLVIGRVMSAADVRTERAGRLSITSCTRHDEWKLGGDRTITWVSGFSAFPNLACLPALSDVAAYERLDYAWVSGIDANPSLALAKCQAEGAERFAAGDIRVSHMRRSAVTELAGQWLDPRSIIAYSPAQRDRLRLDEFDTSRSEWWVCGENSAGQVWIPACLVFYPFAEVPPWLSASAVSSNGMAAFVTAEGALSRAWLELVERDAFQRARITGPTTPPAQVRLATLPQQPRAMLDHIAHRASVRILILPSPTAIPVALVRADTNESIAIGLAANRDATEAVTKAATEAYAQVIHPSLGKVDECAVETPEDHAALYNAPEWRCKLDWMMQGPYVDIQEIGHSQQALIAPRACWYRFPFAQQGLHIVRVLDPDLIPLTFGYDSDPTGRNDMGALLRLSGLSEDRPLEPHPFA